MREEEELKDNVHRRMRNRSYLDDDAYSKRRFLNAIVLLRDTLLASKIEDDVCNHDVA